MKKGFSLIEIIISISLISAIFVFSLFIIKSAKPTYADPYEDIRLIISDAVNVFLNSNVGFSYKEELNKNKEIVVNSNLLIQEGLIEESYYINNIGEKNVENIEIIVLLDDEGFMNYSINIV